jgi:ubiquinol-cytochrome c reductase cytochrome b subunit
MSDNNSENKPKQFLPFWPHYILSETIAWYIMLGILIILATVFPVGVEDKADAFKTPEHVKPEWYFLAVYQFLKVASIFSFLGAEAPKLMGVILPAIGGALLFVLPFLDRAPKRVWRKRPRMIAIVIIVLVVMAVLSYLGQYS